MQKTQRLTLEKDFAAVRRSGRSWSNGLLVLVARPNELKLTRFGFSVGRRVGKAVIRNRIKRRLREAMPLATVLKGWDLVFIARKDAPSATFMELERSAIRLLRRAELLGATLPRPGTPVGEL